VPTGVTLNVIFYKFNILPEMNGLQSYRKEILLRYRTFGKYMTTE